MKYRISTSKAMTKSEIRRVIIKWLLYSICLIFFYSLMRSGAFTTWQPFLIIPLAVSVSLNERELSSCIFSMFCGYLIDISCGFIFGFSAVWLMLVCVSASLLSRNLIRVNFMNFLWITIVTTLLEFSMDYLFNEIIWNKSDKDIILNVSIIPSIISTVIFSPLIYLLIKIINSKCNDNNRFRFYSPESSGDEELANFKE